MILIITSREDGSHVFYKRGTGIIEYDSEYNTLIDITDELERRFDTLFTYDSSYEISDDLDDISDDEIIDDLIE